MALPLLIAGGLAGLNMLGSYAAQKEEEAKQKRIIALKKRAAVQKNAAIQDGAELSGILSHEATINSMYDLYRASAENTREIKGKLDNTRSKLAAQSEGLAAGISKGKQMLAFNVQAAKAIQKQKSKESSVLVNLLDNYYTTQNKLNQKKLQSQQEMQAALQEQYQGPSDMSQFLNIVSSGAKGFQSGYSLGNAFNKQFG